MTDRRLYGLDFQMCEPFGTMSGSFSFPVSTVPAEKLTSLSMMQWSRTQPVSTTQSLITMQSLSLAPLRIRAPEKTMQFSMLPSMMQLSATRELRE